MKMKSIVLFITTLMSGFFISTAYATPCARTTGPYSSGDTLTASSYDSELNNIMTCVNARVEDTGDTVTGNLTINGGHENIYGGYDLKGYSDSGTTLKYSLDTATGNIFAGNLIAAPLTEGQAINCGMYVSGSTFTIKDATGNSLSSTNPCYVVVRSNTTGQLAVATFTSNQSATFGSSSDTDGNLFGITDLDWSSNMPMFVGVVYNGSSSYFTLSRIPLNSTGSASTDICQKGDTDCDAETDGMILTTGLTLASWTSLPITQVGWFDATYATSGSAWTFTLGTNTTGFNQEYSSLMFSFPTGQKGAATGTYLAANGGTAPIFSTNQVYYTWDDGNVVAWYNLQSDGGTDGSGAVAVQLSLPYSANALLTSNAVLGTGVITYNAGASTLMAYFEGAAGINYVSPFLYQGSALQNSDFINGSRLIRVNFSYPVVGNK